MKEMCYWGDPSYKGHLPLSEDIETEVLIIGGGVAGLFAAYFFLQEGVTDITIIEEGTIGSGSTGRSAGMLTAECETASWATLLSKHPIADIRLYHDAQERALSTVVQVIKKGNIACDFALRDYYLVAGKDGNHDRVYSEFHAVQNLGGNPVWLEGDAFSEELTTPLYSSGERMQLGVSVDPMRFIQGVGMYLSSRGVRIYEHTHADAAFDNCVQANGHSVTFHNLVEAKGPAYDGEDAENFITTIGLTKPLPLEVLRSLSLDDRDMFADMVEPSFFYGKVTGEDRIMLGFGDEGTVFRTGMIKLHTPHLEVLQSYLSQLSPSYPLDFEYAWSGIYSLSKTDLPIVSIAGNCAVIAGAGSQIASIALSEYCVHSLLRQEHPLDALFHAQQQQHIQL